MGYDPSGRMTSIVEPRGNEAGADPQQFRSTLVYDNANHVTSVTDPLGHETSWSYDPAGNLVSRTDANDHTTSYGYNPANMLTTVTAPDDSVTSYSYDATGNLVSRTDANDHTTSYSYDGAGRLESVTSPLDQQWSYDYDANGNLKEVVDAAGNFTPAGGDGTTAYGYDAINRLVSIDYSDLTPDASFSYDPNSNRTAMTDGAGTESYSYDALDRLVSVTRGADTFTYDYDPGSNLTRRTYPDGTVIDYGFDDDSRMESITTGGATTSYGYDGAGRVIRTTLPAANGHEELRSYDRAGRLVNVVNQKGTNTLSSAAYDLDPVGNPLAVTTDQLTTTYVYDALDRLTRVCFAQSCPGPQAPFIDYAYDAVGNRLSETRASGTNTYAYNAADQLTSVTEPVGTTNYAYDPNGNQIQAGVKNYTYDLANRMLSATGDVGPITYSYDGDGKRLQASAGSQAAAKTNFIWDINHGLYQPAVERDGNGALVRRFVHGNDLISMRTGGTDYYYHYDGLGSVTNLTSAAGTKQWSYTYGPFGGKLTETKNNPSAPANFMRFTGERFDAQTGLYHLRARQYDPGLGRFTATDPWRARISDPYISSYLYANNRPTVLTDPSGMLPDSVVGMIISGFPFAGPPGSDPIGDALAACSNSLPNPRLPYLQQACKAAKAIWSGTKVGPKVVDFLSEPVDACDPLNLTGETVLSPIVGPICITIPAPPS